MDFEKKINLDVLQDSENIAKLLTKDDLGKLGHKVCQTFDVDKQSRKKW